MSTKQLTKFEEELDIPDNIGNRIEDAPQGQMLDDDVGYSGDGKVLKPGATLSDGLFADTVDKIAEPFLQEGTMPLPEIPEINPFASLMGGNSSKYYQLQNFLDKMEMITNDENVDEFALPHQLAPISTN